ncbi:MAG TPA: hypothetical protein VFG08_00645, partial [Candidatus Polarisedimenticolia bacterium]|nr:hypothetical protein [Candidatus Polarisedimenticolia bacterium]
GPWDMQNSRRLGGLALILVLLFVLLTGGVRLLSRGALLGPGGQDGAASRGLRPDGSERRPVDLPEQVQAAERVAQTAFDRLMKNPPPAASGDRGGTSMADAAAVGASSPEPAPNLEIRLADTVSAERVMLRIDAAAGAMLDSQPESGGGERVRRLSIPPGRHAIEVTLIGADGATAAGSTVEGTLTGDGIAILRIDRLPGPGDLLDLTWVSPEASAGVTGGDRRTRRKE